MQGKSTTVNLLVKPESRKKSFVFRNALKALEAEKYFFSVARFALKLMTQAEKMLTLESLGEEKKERKSRRSNCAWISNCAGFQVSEFLITEPLFSLTSIFSRLIR